MTVLLCSFANHKCNILLSSCLLFSCIHHTTLRLFVYSTTFHAINDILISTNFTMMKVKLKKYLFQWCLSLYFAGFCLHSVLLLSLRQQFCQSCCSFSFECSITGIHFASELYSNEEEEEKKEERIRNALSNE